MPAAVTGRMNITRDFYQGHRSRAMLRLPVNSHPCFHLAVLLSHPLSCRPAPAPPHQQKLGNRSRFFKQTKFFSVPSIKHEQPDPEGCFWASCTLAGDFLSSWISGSGQKLCSSQYEHCAWFVIIMSNNIVPALTPIHQMQSGPCSRVGLNVHFSNIQGGS